LWSDGEDEGEKEGIGSSSLGTPGIRIRTPAARAKVELHFFVPPTTVLYRRKGELRTRPKSQSNPNPSRSHHFSFPSIHPFHFLSSVALIFGQCQPAQPPPRGSRMPIPLVFSLSLTVLTIFFYFSYASCAGTRTLALPLHSFPLHRYPHHRHGRTTRVFISTLLLVEGGLEF
jgi:hypothetical protein